MVQATEMCEYRLYSIWFVLLKTCLAKVHNVLAEVGVQSAGRGVRTAH